jgi:ribonuclease VapC
MVIDTSAIIEIFIDGSEAAKLKAAMKPARGHRFMSAATFVEAHVVIKRRFSEVHDRSRQLLDKMISGYGIDIEALQEAHARLAIDAYHKFGKGTGAGLLNYGDCFSYALAKHRDDALLFIGNDFSRTDVKIVKL